MTRKEIEQERRKILRDPAGYFTCHEVVDKAYKDKVIDKLTADAIHARLGGMSYGKYKGREYLANGRPTVNHINMANVRNFRQHHLAGHRGSGKHLTDSDRDLIKRMYVSEGKSTDVIGDMLGIAGSTVARNLRKMGVLISKSPKKRKTAEVTADQISGKEI